MTAPSLVPWDREPHTAAKHDLYRRYLDRWLPIMLRGFDGDITYAEGFAGPGVYTRGEPGSPVIALRALLDDQRLKPLVRTVRLLFVDHDARCAAMLPERLTASAGGLSFDQLRAHGIDVECRKGTCEPVLEQMLTDHGAWNRPMLVVLDTFGGAVSASLLGRIARNKASEVIVTMQPQYFSRFAADPNIEHGDNVFGAPDWRDVAQQPAAEKTSWLRRRYRQTVADAGFTHVLDFELVDGRGHALYLVYGTTHRQGLKKMKEAMWEVDAIQGIGYRDPRDPQQQTLEIKLEPQTAALLRMLSAHLTGQPGKRATLHQLREFALFETVYKPGQVRTVIRTAINDGHMRRDQRPGDLDAQSQVWLP